MPRVNRSFRARLAIVAALVIGLAACGDGRATPAVPASGSSTRGPSATPGVSAPAATDRPATASPGRGTGLTAIGHVYTIVMENHEQSAILGGSAAPYIAGLARTYARAGVYSAVGHPSQPNYLAMFSGSTQGVTDDANHDIAGASTIADQIEASGRTWHVAAQNVPPGCFTGSSASGGADGPGTYARKHEPAISFTQIARDPTRCASITDFAHFDPELGDYWFIAPNLCNDMHDCSIATGDAFLAGFVPRILGSAAFRKDGVLFLTFDEGSTATGGGGDVVMLVIAANGRRGFVSSTPYDHYAYLRTIEDAWSLPCLALACSATAMGDFFP